MKLRICVREHERAQGHSPSTGRLTPWRYVNALVYRIAIIAITFRPFLASGAW